MMLRQWLKRGEEQLLAGPHAERARRDAELLLLHLLGKDRAWLMAHGDELLHDNLVDSYKELLDRRLRGEPVQYITGAVEFYGLSFRVTPDVLIPRPETEHLVEKVVELAARLQDTGAKAHKDFSELTARLSFTHEAVRIVDVGTGSGAIAVTLVHELPSAAVTAIDLSSRALEVAAENAQRNGVELRLLEGDLLAPVMPETFELVVSNPPYVPSADRDSLPVEVREFEPALALFAGNDGLDLYRQLIPAAFDVLVPGGFLALEIGYGQSVAIERLLDCAGFKEVEFVSDLQGIARVASARRP